MIKVNLTRYDAVEMKELCGNLIINIIGRTISGKPISPNDDEAVRVTKVSAMNLDNILERWSDEHKKRRDTGLKGESKPYFTYAIESSKQQM
nr:cytochrome P450 [Tanacetum cinerariifolium]